MTVKAIRIPAVRVQQPPDEIQLTLSEEHAQALYDILRYVGGPNGALYSKWSRRAYADSIFEVLYDLVPDKREETGITDMRGEITFFERKRPE